MYYYGGSSCGCGNNTSWNMPYYPYGYTNSSNNNYAIILVLFILLVIVIGARGTR